jgi:hypothetical protein
MNITADSDNNGQQQNITFADISRQIPSNYYSKGVWGNCITAT